MKTPFSIDKSYRIRHKILEVLYNDWNANNHAENRRVGSIRIATDTGIPIAEIHRLQYLLVEKGEINISENDGQSIMTLQPNGITAYVDKLYIKEGYKQRWDGIYDWARILIPLVALLLSLYNYYYSYYKLDTKILKIETKIEQLKK